MVKTFIAQIYYYYEPYMKESEPKGCIYHTNKDVQPFAKFEIAWYY